MRTQLALFVVLLAVVAGALAWIVAAGLLHR